MLSAVWDSRNRRLQFFEASVLEDWEDGEAEKDWAERRGEELGIVGRMAMMFCGNIVDELRCCVRCPSLAERYQSPDESVTGEVL